MPVISADEEIALIKNSLEQAESARMARVEVIWNTTKDSLESTIESFRPHVFHLIGHTGLVNGAEGITLEGEAGAPYFMSADRLGPFMRQYGVLLAVLHDCAIDGPNPAGMPRGACQALVRSGVPAVIGTTRPVDDTTALRFAGQFYQGMGDGLAAEAALVEARKAISVQGWDWSMYAIYANTDFPLHTISIQPR